MDALYGNQRSRIELYINLLDKARAGKKKTRLMYATNTSYKDLCKLLLEAISKGHIAQSGTDYQITESGIRLLESWNAFTALFLASDSTTAFAY